MGAWGAAPASAGAGFQDQTLRMVLAPHAGGRVARVRLTNRFGTGPVTFGAVRLARRAAGAAILAATSRTVTFRGRTSVTVAGGADVVSDPVRLRVRAFQDLAVSVFVAGPSGPATTHPVASEAATYLAAGDRTRDHDGAAFGPPTGSWPFLAGVDVRAPGRAGAVVAFGDSITDGFQSTIARPAGARDTRWPDVLARRLLAAHRPLAVVNEGISGNRVRLDALPRSRPSSARAGCPGSAATCSPSRVSPTSSCSRGSTTSASRPRPRRRRSSRGCGGSRRGSGRPGCGCSSAR